MCLLSRLRKNTLDSGRAFRAHHLLITDEQKGCVYISGKDSDEHEKPRERQDVGFTCATNTNKEIPKQKATSKEKEENKKNP